MTTFVITLYKTTVIYSIISDFSPSIENKGIGKLGLAQKD